MSTPAQKPSSPPLDPGVTRVVYSADQIQHRIRELGLQISADYAGKNPLLVGVLKGVIFFATDLLRCLTIPVSLDFMAISRYNANRPAPGAVRLVKDLEEPVEGRHLLFIEDVVDTGLTLSYLLRILRERDPASLETCTLFSRPQRRIVNVRLRYVGFELPDHFVVGYGLDYKEAYRQLPYVGELSSEVLRGEKINPVK